MRKISNLTTRVIGALVIGSTVIGCNYQPPRQAEMSKPIFITGEVIGESHTHFLSKPDRHVFSMKIEEELIEFRTYGDYYSASSDAKITPGYLVTVRLRPGQEKIKLWGTGDVHYEIEPRQIVDAKPISEEINK